MNWENILKVQVLGSKQRVKQGIRPLPKEDKTNCKDTLRQWHKNAYDTQTKIWEHLQDAKHERGYTYSKLHHAPRKFNEEKFETIPEGVACKTIEIVNQFIDGNENKLVKHIAWADNAGGYYKDGSSEPNRIFEVMCQYSNNGEYRLANVMGQDNMKSHLKVFLWETLPTVKTTLWIAEIILAKPAYDAFLNKGVDFEEYDIKELDFRR